MKRAAMLVPLLLLLILVARTTRAKIRHRGENTAAAAKIKTVNVEDRDSISCPNCFYKTDARQTEADRLRLEAIKGQILSKLGLIHRPNVSSDLPREMVMETLFAAEDNKEFFGDPVDELGDVGGRHRSSTTSERTAAVEVMDYDDFYGRTSEIISFAEEGKRVNNTTLLNFVVSSAESGQARLEFRVRSATLWVKADIRHRRPDHQCRSEIYVFKVISGSLRNTISKQDFVVMDTLNETRPGWQKLDVTSTVQKWLQDPAKTKLQLLVDCSCCSHWHLHHSNQKAWKPNRPFLVVRTDPSTAKRVRRRALDCSEDSGNQCCKQRFYVSFKQLGWDDWVIAPQGYYANYCRGDCGIRTPDTFVTYHTHVIEEARKTRHLSGMQPCCAPLKFSSISLIYYGPDLNIIKRDLPKMMVDECGCP